MPSSKSNVERKPLNTAQRVEILLRVGVEHPERWATVHGYEDPKDLTHDDARWSDEWKRLRAHHLAETNFLFDIIREMREQILSMEESLDNVPCVVREDI